MNYTLLPYNSETVAYCSDEINDDRTHLPILYLICTKLSFTHLLLKFSRKCQLSRIICVACLNPSLEVQIFETAQGLYLVQENQAQMGLQRFLQQWQAQ